MGTKTVTLRLPEELVEYLTEKNKSINQAVISEIVNYRRMKDTAYMELAGVFTENEWLYLIDSYLNEALLLDDYMCDSVGIFVFNVMESERFSNKAEKFGIDMKELVSKIRKLHSANIIAMYERLETYRKKSGKIDIKKWANF